MLTKIENLIVVLGSPNDDEGCLSGIGMGRTELAYQTWKDLCDPNCKILLTGGYGEHFNRTLKPNAFYAMKRLLQLGVPERNFIEIAESVNTVDDALKSFRIVECYDVNKILLISSDFHLERVQFIFDIVFNGRIIEYLGASYLGSVSLVDKKRLLDHEARELRSLKEKGESIVGGALSIYSKDSSQNENASAMNLIAKPLRR